MRAHLAITFGSDPLSCIAVFSIFFPILALARAFFPPTTSYLEAIISETTNPAPKQLTKFLKGTSVIPASGARKTGKLIFCSDKKFVILRSLIV